MTFPAEYHAELLGEYAAQAESRNRLLTLAGFALLGIFLLLFVDFGEARPAVLVFLTLPFALVGGVMAALLSGGCYRWARSWDSSACSASPRATASC